MRTLLVSSLIVTALASGSAQVPAWQREQVPLTFAQPSPELRAQFAADWKRLEPKGREWKYCINAWTVGTTKDGDTVYIATSGTLQETRATAISTGEHSECQDGHGHKLPTAHAHITGDCSPSRGDVTEAFRRMPLFDLVICGPGITNGYIWTTFRVNP